MINTKLPITAHWEGSKLVVVFRGDVYMRGGKHHFYPEGWDHDIPLSRLHENVRLEVDLTPLRGRE